MRRALLVFAALSLVTAVAPAAADAVTFRNGDGLTLASTKQLDSRLIALTVKTAALPGPANIRILLPAGYAAHPHKRYPVLYLLHGTSGGASDWTTMGQAEQTTAGKPVIVVMPDIALNDDGGGWCTNWPDGLYKWETFHIDQLIPWVDSNLRTIATRDGRAIAGLSQGGFCSMSYAARHPDLFITALAYSGAPDIAYDTEAQALVTPIINATEVGLDGVPANSMFGPRTSNEINWAAHDPATLAANLQGMKLLMYAGNGEPGPLDPGPPTLPNPGAMAIEAGVYQLTTMFHNRLDALGIPSYIDLYGAGTHSWPYWTRDLQQSIGAIMADFAHPPAAPRSMTYTSADPSYSVFGWTVATHRLVREFSTLAGAGVRGFTLQGSGSATVTTPAVYKRGVRYVVTIAGKRRTVRVGRSRRLMLQVPLGPSDTVQEYPDDGPALGTHVYTTRVTIALRKAR